MKVRMLGSGTSTGVPRVNGDWGECDPREPRNMRTRPSILLENDAGNRILVDTTPDMRQQLLAAGTDRIDAVFWTHDHADHCHGIDDLRVLRFGRSAPIPGYAAAECAHRLRRRFDYVFANQSGYQTIVALEPLDSLRLCAGFALDWCQMPHGGMESTGLRFEADGIAIGYATDYREITDDMIAVFSGVDWLISDCLRREPHPTHAHLDMAIELGERVGATTVVLTHLDKSMDYATLNAETPDHVMVGFDGLELVG